MQKYNNAFKICRHINWDMCESLLSELEDELRGPTSETPRVHNIPASAPLLVVEADAAAGPMCERYDLTDLSDPLEVLDGFADHLCNVNTAFMRLSAYLEEDLLENDYTTAPGHLVAPTDGDSADGTMPTYTADHSQIDTFCNSVDDGHRDLCTRAASALGNFRCAIKVAEKHIATNRLGLHELDQFEVWFDLNEFLSAHDDDDDDNESAYND